MTGIMAFEGAGGLPHPIITTSPTDLAAGIFMAYAVAAALYQRERSGRGQQIETSLFAAGIAIQYRPMFSIERIDRAPRQRLLETVARARAAGKRVDEVLGEQSSRTDVVMRRNNPYYRVFETKDSYIALACLNNRLRRAAARVLEVEDPRVEGDEFDVDLLGPDESMVLRELIAATFTNRTTDEWVELFDAAGVPCGPVRLTAELFDDPQVVADELLVELDHPIMGPVKMANSPLKMSGGETGSRLPSPALGQHTRELLGELGYTAGEIAALEASGAVRAWKRD
jgi:formyl-CoA transferase